jgi:cytoskeletal protein CcmA (bactofilin family)
MQQFKKKRMEDQIGVEESKIAAQTKLKGTLTGIESICIAGQVEGDIQCGRLVWIEKGGNVKGDIHAKYIIIEGKIAGNIEDAEHVEIREEAHVSGNIQTQKIAMAEGSFFKGEIHMPRDIDEPIHFTEKRKPKNKMKEEKDV